MNKVLETANRTLLSLSNEELVAIGSATNEVCNGLHIEDWEFHTRLGVTREFLRNLLGAMNLESHPSRRVSELLGAWEDQGGVMVRAVDVYGDPLELGENEAQAFAERLKTAIRKASSAK